MDDYDDPPPGHVHGDGCLHSSDYWHREVRRIHDAQAARRAADARWWRAMLAAGVVVLVAASFVVALTVL